MWAFRRADAEPSRHPIQETLVTAHVIAYDTANPGDVSDFSRNLARFEPARIRKLALLVKTEGNSDVNDYSREFALLSLNRAIEEHGGKALLDRSTFLISTGCEGAMTPFGYLFVDMEEAATSTTASPRRTRRPSVPWAQASRWVKCRASASCRRHSTPTTTCTRSARWCSPAQNSTASRSCCSPTARARPAT
jgi:hypothetical protein